MALVTFGDVQTEIPGLDLRADTVPSVADVERYIADIEAEVTSHLIAYGAGMPAYDTPQGTMVRRIVLEGVRWLTMRAMFSGTSSEFVPDDVDNSRQTYHDKLKELRILAQALTKSDPGLSSVAIPQLGSPATAPSLGVGFDEWTHLVAQQWPGRGFRNGIY